MYSQIPSLTSLAEVYPVLQVVGAADVVQPEGVVSHAETIKEHSPLSGQVKDSSSSLCNYTGKTHYAGESSVLM